MAIPAMQYLIRYFRQHTTRVPRPTFTAGMGGWDEASFLRSYVGGADGVDYFAYRAGTERHVAQAAEVVAAVR